MRTRCFLAARFDSDFSAAIHLIGELRAARPEIYINLTTGAWPSPFWLLYADSIWRGGEDDSTAGAGPYRERWITYRDADTYRRIVENGPLYPLNSLMLHGLIFAQHHISSTRDPGNDFRNEIRSYFGAGTQLQEMYITPKLLNSQIGTTWPKPRNGRAPMPTCWWTRTGLEAIRLAESMAGPPGRRKGIMVLRNPSDRPQDHARGFARRF